jgi:hypothetical protein
MHITGKEKTVAARQVQEQLAVALAVPKSGCTIIGKTGFIV